MTQNTSLFLKPMQRQRLSWSTRLFATLATALDRLDGLARRRPSVIGWGAPILSFGDLSAARVATVGLNPSNREFVDQSGRELQGRERRFHTLRSLGIEAWSEVDSSHLQLILDSCRDYFLVNPYDRWFKRLDQVLAESEASFYSDQLAACHVDLIPYATARKWTALSQQERADLLRVSADTLGLLLRDSAVEVLILNGQTVVDHFENLAGIRLDRVHMSAWSLPRKGGVDVSGFGYKAEIDALAGVLLSRPVLILGYNHNIQSSFGVTTAAITGICKWIGQTLRERRYCKGA